MAVPRLGIRVSHCGQLTIAVAVVCTFPPPTTVHLAPLRESLQKSKFTTAVSVSEKFRESQQVDIVSKLYLAQNVLFKLFTQPPYQRY